MEKSWPGAPRSIWKKCEPGFDKLPLSSDWNICMRMLCVARLGLARWVDSLETVYNWEKVGSPTRVILSCQPSDPTPRARFAVSHVNGRWWFISNCRKTWLAPVGSGEGYLGSPGQCHFYPCKQGPRKWWLGLQRKQLVPALLIWKQRWGGRGEGFTSE